MIGSASGYMYALSMLAGMLGLLFNGPGAVSVDGSSERRLLTSLRRAWRPARVDAVTDQP
jgi:hypothetical protein